jgi:hypothetical protein
VVDLKPDVTAVDETPKDFKRVGQSDALTEAAKVKPKPVEVPKPKVKKRSA